MANDALIQTAAAPLWKEPKKGAERVDEALCGVPVEILESSGIYRRVRTCYGYEGWAEEPALFPPASLEAWKAAPKALVRAPFADVQAEPSVQAPAVCTLPRGALVQLDAPAGTGKWSRVLLPNAVPGFLPASALTRPHTGLGRRSPARFRCDVVRAACSYLGAPYRWGGMTPAGIDCSGLCFMAYALNGVCIFRDARLEPGYAIQKIPYRLVRPGDLLYFPGHVAMFIGNGRYIHATAGNGCHGVVVNSLDPRSPQYRADLPPKLLATGSLFP